MTQKEGKSASGLDEFFSLQKNYSKLAAVAFGNATILIISELSDLIPPWEKGSMIAVSALFQLVAMVVTFQGMGSATRKRVSTLITRQAFLLVIFFAVYLAAFSVLTFQANHEVLIRGIQCSEQALLVFGSDCPLLSYEQIKSSGYMDTQLWTPLGLAVSRVALISLWLMVLYFFVRMITAFVVFQARVRSKALK